MKELENLGHKVGVISNTVKDVVQSLIDDNLVETDKIGVGNYFWSLPSKGRQIRMNKLEDIKAKIMEYKTQKKALSQNIKNQLADKPDTSERLEKLQELKNSIATLETLTNQKDSLKSCTKAYYDECQEKVSKLTANYNTYTENILLARSYLKNANSSISVSEINKHFGIPDDLDTI